ncbi:MAG: Cys-tRNA(Pro) deacylase [Peptococcaceae bacterium]|nr:Cys-tRNA(Pro) deacylase [Peptococcaceae bacterium]
MNIGQKTNAIRILEAQGIPYELYSYPVDDGLLDAVSVARKSGFNPDVVYKTLVATGKKTGINVFVIPGNCELDLKKAAQAAGDKNIEMLKAKELLPATGYIHGGCSPLGMKKQYPTFIEEIASQYDFILVSAGRIGLQVKLKPESLIKIIGAKYADLI